MRTQNARSSFSDLFLVNFHFPVMLCRFAAAAIILSCLVVHGWGQPGAPASALSASPQKKDATRPAPTGPCKVGVIPIAGNLFLVEKFGPLRFTDTYERTAVEAWALDDLVVSRVQAAVPNGSVRRISFTKEELAHYRFEPSLFPSQDAHIREFAQYVARGAPCERYVVVHRYGRSGHKEFGIGVSRYPLDGHAYLFVIMYIRIYDGRTFDLIKQGPASIDDDSLLDRMRNAVGGPFRVLDAAAFPDKPADVAASSVLRDGVRSLLTASLDRSLPALLGPAR